MNSFEMLDLKDGRVSHFRVGSHEVYSNGQVFFMTAGRDLPTLASMPESAYTDLRPDKDPCFIMTKWHEYFEKFTTKCSKNVVYLNDSELERIRLIVKGVGKCRRKEHSGSDVLMFYLNRAVAISESGEQSECRGYTELDSDKFAIPMSVALWYVKALGRSLYIAPSDTLSYVTFDMGEGRKARKFVGYIANVILDPERISYITNENTLSEEVI